MYITYKHKGTTFHVAACLNCKASMTMTAYQFIKLHNVTVSSRKIFCLDLFDYLGCCSKPDFLWGGSWT